MNERLTFSGVEEWHLPQTHPPGGDGDTPPHISPLDVSISAPTIPRLYAHFTPPPLTISGYATVPVGLPVSPEHSIGNEVCRYNWLWRHDAGSMIARKKNAERDLLYV